MARIRLIFLCCLALLSVSCVTTPTEKPQPRVTLSPLFDTAYHNRLAVFVNDQTRRLTQTGVLREIEDEFMRAVMDKGYTLASRSDIDQVAKELRLQRSDLTEKQIAQIGRILNVPAVVIVSVNSLGTERYQPLIKIQGQDYFRATARVSARIVTVEQGEVLWISSYSDHRDFGDKDRQNEAVLASYVASIVATGLPPRARR